MSTFAAQPPPGSLITRLRLFAADIKVSHTVFALPWALLAMFLSANGWPHPGQIVLIVLCMVTARTVAMSANRLLDARLDSLNPRTARRAIPSGRLSPAFVASILISCSLVFIGVTALFGIFYHNWLPAIFALPVLAFICGYPLLKRFSAICHYYLGAALALAPLCAWIAIGGKLVASPFLMSPFLMSAAVMLWTAGFDIIYACQDYESDRQTGVYSVPARLGIAKALWVARLTHLLCLAVLVSLAVITPQFGLLFGFAVGIAGFLLVIEHSLVKPTDLSKVGLAFFTINGIISLLIGTLGILDVFF